MGVRDKFNSLSLIRQMQVLFITSSLLICVVLILLTKFQLDWIENKLVSDSDEVYKARVLSQMKALAKLEVKTIQSELSNYAVLVEILKRTDEIFHKANLFYEYENPFNTSTAYPHYLSSDWTFEHGVYYSRKTIGSEGAELAKTESCFNKIYPAMYTDISLGYYQGYEVDDLFIFYPGIIMENEFNPKIREWYYKATQNTSITTITEPYIDSSVDLLMVSFSKAILNEEGEYFGVAACDVALTILAEKAKKIKILESGYSILVTKDGMMVNVPESWKIIKTGSLELIKIFDTDKTEITLSQWETIKSLDENSLFKFKDLNNIEFKMMKKDIRPFYDNDEITHYFLLFVKSDELNFPKVEYIEAFADKNVVLFWLIFSFGVVIFSSIFVLISLTIRKMQRRMKFMEINLRTIIMRALFKDVTKNVDISEIGVGDKEIESLDRALKLKIFDLKEKEKKLKADNIGETRPCDKFIYSEWSEIMYPFNSNYHKKPSMRELFYKLKRKA